MATPQSNKEWDPAAVMQALDMSIDELASSTDPSTGEPVHTGREGKYEKLAKDKMQRSAPLAADRLIHIMMYSDNETLSAKCAQYLLEKVLGKVTDKPLIGGGSDDLLAQLVNGVVNGN